MVAACSHSSGVEQRAEPGGEIVHWPDACKWAYSRARSRAFGCAARTQAAPAALKTRRLAVRTSTTTAVTASRRSGKCHPY